MLLVRSWLLISLIVALSWMTSAVASVPVAAGTQTVNGTINAVSQDKNQFQLIDVDGMEWTFHVDAFPLIMPKSGAKPIREASKSAGEAPNRFDDVVAKSTFAFALVNQFFSTNFDWLECLKPGQVVQVTYQVIDGRKVALNVQRK